jgi:integrase
LLNEHGPFESIEDAQAAVDAWRKEHNTGRPHQSLAMAFPAARFASATGQELGLRVPAVLRDATHWDEVATRLGYGYLRRHDLRHTGLTWMADAGVPVHVLRKIAGHRSLTTTQRYLHLNMQSVADAGQALSAHLGAS